MSDKLIAVYKSKSSIYFRYEDKWTYMNSNSTSEIPLDNAEYLSEIGVNKIWEDSEGKKLSEIEELIKKNNQLEEAGGMIISILKKDNKISLRKSGIINNIEKM